jgi:Sulfotransferase domain
MAFLMDTGRVNETWRPIYIGKYALHLRRWLEIFPGEQILILSGEKLISDPISEVKKLEEFLGLEPVITEDHFVFNEIKGFMCYKSFDKRKTECLHKAKGRDHPAVDPIALLKLRDFYKPHNQELSELAGINFEW